MLVCFFCLSIFYCFYLIYVGIPTERFPESFIEIILDLAEIKQMFLLVFFCLFVCLFLVELSWDTHRKIFGKFCKDWTWFGWDIFGLKYNFFVCLCVWLFFVWIILRYKLQTWRFPESFINITVDLVEINMYVCLFLFVCSFVYIMFILSKIPWTG